MAGPWEQYASPETPKGPWESYSAPTNQTPDTSYTGALARGGEQAANALGAIVGEAGRYIGGGKTFPKWMAGAAAALHNPAYRSGMEDAANPNASLGDRAAGVGRAIVEGAPGMALSGVAGLVAGVPGFVGTQALLNSGNAVQGVRAADNVAPDQNLSASQLARVGGATTVDTLLASLGAGKALAPVGKGVGSAIKGVLGSGAVGGAANAGQDIADRAIIDGQLPNVNELGASALTGAVAGGGVHAVHGLPSAAMPDRFSNFSQHDPRLLATVAAKLKEQAQRVGPIKESNAGRVIDEAQQASKSVREEIDARGGLTQGGNIVKSAVDAVAQTGDVHVPYVFSEMTNDLKRGQPINPEHISTLESAIGGQDPYIDQWLERAKQESVINQLGQMGTRQGDTIKGGLHATAPGQTLDRLAKYFGMGGISSGLGASLLGHAALGNVGLGIGAGATALSLGVRGIDALTGYSNPVGRFVKRFGDEQPVRSWNPAMAAKAERERQFAAAEDFAKRANMDLANVDRMDATAAKKAADEAKALKKVNDKKIKETKDTFINTLGRVDKADAIDAAKAQAKIDAFQKTIGGLKDPYEPQYQRLGRDMAEPANMPENPNYGSSTPVDAKKLARDAQFAKRISGDELARMNKFDNEQITQPTDIPMDDPMRQALIDQWLRHMTGDSDQSQASSTRRELAKEQEMIDAGIDMRNIGLPDNERFSGALSRLKSRLGQTPMEQVFPTPETIPNAPAYPVPKGPRVDAQAGLKAKLENRSQPTSRPKSAPKETTRGSAMTVVMQDAPKSTRDARVHTFELGRGKWPIRLDESKIRLTTEDGMPDVNAVKRGMEGRILAREDFIDAVKDNVNKKFHGRLNTLMAEYAKTGMNHTLAQKKFDAVVDKLPVSDARKGQLRTMYAKSPLSKKNHWK